MVSQKYLKKIFNYDAKSGNLIWKDDPTSPRNKRFKGKVVGHISTAGYRTVQIKANDENGLKQKNNILYLNRLIYIWHNGAMKEGDKIKFINNNREDLHIENLEAYTPLPPKEQAAHFKAAIYIVQSKSWTQSVCT